MDLETERRMWGENIRSGQYPERANAILEEYRYKRFEKDYRLSSVAEQFCEIIFYLEDRIQELKTNMSRYKND